MLRYRHLLLLSSLIAFAAGDAGPDAKPLGAESVFEIGSITKVFTSIILADMVAKGEVALDDPVARYLPEAAVTMPTRAGREITLLDLATHRSALPRMPDNFDPADPSNPFADYTVEQMYAFLSNHELRRDIGAEPEYSNLAVGLLGHTLALVCAQSRPRQWSTGRGDAREPRGAKHDGWRYENRPELGCDGRR